MRAGQTVGSSSWITSTSDRLREFSWTSLGFQPARPVGCIAMRTDAAVVPGFTVWDRTLRESIGLRLIRSRRKTG